MGARSFFGQASYLASAFLIVVSEYHDLFLLIIDGACRNRVSCGLVRWAAGAAVDTTSELSCAPACCVWRGDVVVADLNGDLELVCATCISVTCINSYTFVSLSNYMLPTL